MSEIPDDVMKRARRLIYETIGAVDFPNGKFLIEGYYDDSLIEAIASALMEERRAERERAIRLCKERARQADLAHGSAEDSDYHIGAEQAANELADAIRGQP